MVRKGFGELKFPDHSSFGLADKELKIEIKVRLMMLSRNLPLKIQSSGDAESPCCFLPAGENVLSLTYQTSNLATA